MRMPLLLCTLLPMFFSGSAMALDGERDWTFGSNGQIAIARPLDNNNLQPTGDLVILEDGRFIWAAPLTDGSLWIGRASRNGAADLSFGSNGDGRITLPGCGEKRNVRLISDQAGGAFLWSSSCLRHIVSDGTLEAGFGSGAMPSPGFFAADIARDPLGRFVLAGREGLTAKVYRFDQNGSPDMSFGGAGSVTVAIPATSGDRDVRALLVRPDGRVLVGGTRSSSSRYNLFVVQLLSNGLPDPTWGTNGLVDLSPPTGVHTLSANAMALDADGTVVVAGHANNSSQNCCVLLTRLDMSGQIVPGFGLRLHALSGNPGLSPFGEQQDGIVILPNHRILVGTVTFPLPLVATHRTQYGLIRMFPDGRIDARFGHDGWNSFTIADPDGAGQAGDYNQMHAIAHDAADGSMLILGRTFFEDNSTKGAYVSLVRARMDLIFDAAFEPSDF